MTTKAQKGRFELSKATQLYRDIKYLDMAGDMKKSVKARIRDKAFYAYKNFDHKREQNLSFEELQALKISKVQ